VTIPEVRHSGGARGGTEDSTSAPENSAPNGGVKSQPRWTRHLSFQNIGAVYVWALIIVVFSIWAPDTFPTWQTVQSVLNQNAIAGLVALALVVPLSARIFDLSVGNAMGLCNVVIAWLLVDQGMPIGIAILLTLAAGVIIGLVNAVVVIVWGIDSFIATLATGSLMAAATSLVTSDQAIIGDQLSGDFAKLATSSVGGIAVPVFSCSWSRRSRGTCSRTHRPGGGSTRPALTKRHRA
jgi:ribose transport system permease protein